MIAVNAKNDSNETVTLLQDMIINVINTATTCKHYLPM